MTEETWADVVGWEGWYEVSDQGRVRSCERPVTDYRGNMYWHSGQLRTLHLNSQYAKVALWTGGETQVYLVHDLVLEAFVGPAPTPDHVPLHKNLDLKDNRLENLEWVTREERLRYTTDSGEYYRHPRSGERNHKSKLTWDEVREIRRGYNDGEFTQAEAAEIYGVSQTTIKDIVTGQAWFDPEYEPCVQYRLSKA